jgi:hypothetical protein
MIADLVMNVVIIFIVAILVVMIIILMFVVMFVIFIVLLKLILVFKPANMAQTHRKPNILSIRKIANYVNIRLIFFLSHTKSSVDI